MRGRHTALAAVVILAVSACTGANPAPPTPAAPRSVSSATTPTSSGAATGAADWPTYHGTMSRAGMSTTMPPASGTPKRIQSLKLDGEVFASPIVVRGLTIVATEQDTVYAFDQSYRQVWKRSLGSPSPAQEKQRCDINLLGMPERRSTTQWTATSPRGRTGRIGAAFLMPWMHIRPRGVAQERRPARGERQGLAAGRRPDDRGQPGLGVASGAPSGDCGDYERPLSWAYLAGTSGRTSDVVYWETSPDQIHAGRWHLEPERSHR